ncbi:MAG: hypothetical protein J7M08_05230, partial [Planctomycetes bacterium]|nr:hypothetical protein [Planctomycetota bacterium]
MARIQKAFLILPFCVLSGLILLAGCAPGQLATIPPADLELMLTQADQAYQKEDFQNARTFYDRLSRHKEELSQEQQDQVETRLARAQSVLYQRKLTSQKEKEQALAHYDAGMAAYKSKQYEAAAKELKAAAASEAELGAKKDQKARDVLAEVEGEIKAVQEAYKAGQTAYDEGKLEEARSQLERVKGSEIALAKGLAPEVDKMLAQIEKAFA